jgi:hypothetical protein
LGQNGTEALPSQASAGTSHSSGTTSRGGLSSSVNTTTARSQPLASSNASGPSGPVSMPSRYGTARNRKSRLFSILQHPGVPAVGVVPLQLTQPQSCPSPILPTPTPLSPLPHSEIPAPFTATDSLSPEMVSLVVRKTLEQIGVHTVEATGMRRRGQTSLGQKRGEIKKQRLMISGDADKEWKVCNQDLG